MQGEEKQAVPCVTQVQGFVLIFFSKRPSLTEQFLSIGAEELTEHANEAEMALTWKE
jgi:hypothetical protein